MKSENNKYKILFFTSFNDRSIHMESSVLYFQKKGYNVYFLTTCMHGPIHQTLKNKSVVCDSFPFTNTSGILFYLKAILFFIRYCRARKIDFVYSHLQIPNFISSLAQLFIKSVVFNVRHNSDVIEIDGSPKEILMERAINFFSAHIIAISDKVSEQLVLKEGVKSKKIHRINNGYDFYSYNELSLDVDESKKLRAKYSSKLMIVSPGRLIKTKRHTITIDGIKELIEQGLDIELLILGEGPEKSVIANYIVDNKLQNKVHLLGFVENISDYMKASDIVVLLSNSEASSNIVKEAAFYEKPVIVCENVGDFSDYIINGKNGFLVSKENPKDEFISIVQKFNNNPNDFSILGKNLKLKVLKEFDITEVGRKYEDLQNNLIK